MKTSLAGGCGSPGMIFVAGTAFAAAWLIRGRQSWDLALIIEVTILIAAIATYIRGGSTPRRARWPPPSATSASS